MDNQAADIYTFDKSRGWEIIRSHILRDSVTTIVQNGIKYNQLKKNIDIEGFATLVIASLEGAIMMSKLRGNNDDIRRIIVFLEKELREIEL